MAVLARADVYERAIVGTWIGRVAAVLAGCGGLVLLAVAVITVVSVLGRAVPVIPSFPGDFELVEMGAAVAVFLFLPWCQLSGGQVSIDFLSARFGAKAHAVFGLIGNVALTGVSGVLAWRLWLGFGEKFPFGADPLRAALGLGSKPYFTETTYDLQIPVWIAYALCLPGAFWLVVACGFTAWRSVGWVCAGGEP